jgi:hypothetical protein
MAVSLVQSVWAARGLFADGAYYMWVVLSTGEASTYPSRILTQLVTQAPLIAAIDLGVDDVAVLVRLQSIGTAALPVAIWIAALVVVIRHSIFWPMVAVFAIVFLNTGFMSVGEYNMAYALAGLSFALLARPGPVMRGGRVLLVILAALMPFSYESIALLVPLLGLMIILKVRAGAFSDGPTTRWTVIALVLILLFYAVAAVVAAVNIIVPRDATNIAGAADFLGAFQLDLQLTISVLGGLAFLAAAYLLPARLHWIGGSLALAAGVWILAQPTLWAQPWMHFISRTVVGVVMLVMLTIIWLGETLRPDATARRSGVSRLVPAVGVLALFLALLAPLTLHTHRLANWTRQFDLIVSEPGSPIPLTETALPPAADYSWTWTNPFLSQVLGEGEVIILSPGLTLDDQQLPGEILPRFVTTTPVF